MDRALWISQLSRESIVEQNNIVTPSYGIPDTRASTTWRLDRFKLLNEAYVSRDIRKNPDKFAHI